MRMLIQVSYHETGTTRASRKKLRDDKISTKLSFNNESLVLALHAHDYGKKLANAMIHFGSSG